MVRIRQARFGHVEADGKRQRQRQGKRRTRRTRRTGWAEGPQSTGEGAGCSEYQHRPRLQMLRQIWPRQDRVQEQRQHLRQLLGNPAISREYAEIPRRWSMQAKTQQRGQQLLRSRRPGLQFQKSSSHHGFVEVVCIRMQTITWPNAKSAPGRKPPSQSRPPHQNLLFGNRCST